MKKALSFTPIFLLICGINQVYSQTRLQQASTKWSGVHIGVGIGMHQMVNENYKNNIDQKIIKNNLGIQVGLEFLFYPISFDFAYSYTGFTVPGRYEKEDEGLSPIKLTSLDSQLKFYCFPSAKMISPYVSGGYSIAGISNTENENIDQEVDLSDFSFGTGLSFQFTMIKLDLFYSRTLNLQQKDRVFNQLGARFSLNMSRFDYAKN